MNAPQTSNDASDRPGTNGSPTACPACGSRALDPFYTVEQVPAHSVLLMRTREQARDFPTGTLRLAVCADCGFISNTAFDPSLQDYSTEYEETQGFSGTFNAFHRRLAEDLIQRHDLRGKRVVEIGCGKGDFLHMLCDLGGNTGLGFDPAYVPERDPGGRDHRVRFVQDFYTETNAPSEADFICCKMTLEHIPDVARLVRTVRRSLGSRTGTTVFFQIPEVRRILRDRAFWDIYYEHCSYFSAGSLGRLFRQQGFDVLDLWTDYDDQYLMIEARPAPGPVHRSHPEEEPVSALQADVADFAARIGEVLDGWRHLLRVTQRNGQRVVLWGGGSKAVAFLTTLGVRDEVAYAVDINPYKRDTFLAGTGHRILSPSDLREQPPDVVIIMNPIYRAEIQRDLHAMQLAPALFHIDLNPLDSLALS